MSGVVEGPVHLVGIGGIHMSAIGQLLMEQGVAVSGSDLRLSAITARLEQLGATVSEGHAAENVGHPKLVVTTAAADDANPEIVAARERGIPVILRAEMVARLMEGKQVIAVAGSHGKTTTSAAIAFVLREAALKPMYLLGGESRDLGGHAAWGGPLCVVEADEYKRAFHEYSPWLGIILNVEADHLDYYGTAEAYSEAFTVFGRTVRPDGTVLACGDDSGAMEAAGRLDGGAKVETFGIETEGIWQAINVNVNAEGVAFAVLRDGKALGMVQSTLSGRHSVYNLLAATAAGLHCEIPFAAVASALSHFSGADRRFQRVGEAGGVLVMDDYAHHPSEVRAILAAAKLRFPRRRIVVLHQPHTYSRIAYLWDEWTRCWDDADVLVIVETYAARERPEQGRGAAELAKAINRPARYAATFDEAAEMAASIARTGDVVFTVGAGDVNEVGPKLLELLR
jgi:UDP-N-acetylmuramate--alanine ligase